MCEKISDILSALQIDTLYTEKFLNNGFHNLSQCIGINEQILKDIGVDKPGTIYQSMFLKHIFKSYQILFNIQLLF